MVSTMKLTSLLALTIIQLTAATTNSTAPATTAAPTTTAVPSTSSPWTGLTSISSAACTSQNPSYLSCNGGCYDPTVYCCYNGGLGQAADTVRSCPGYVAPSQAPTTTAVTTAATTPSSGEVVVTSCPSTVNNVPATPVTPVTQSGDFSCGTGLNICTVYDPVVSSKATPTCYDGHVYTCIQPSADYLGQFLCPMAAPNLCGRACYSSANYTCLVDPSNVYDSKLLQTFTLGNTTYATGLLALQNNQYQITFLPVEGQVNYVIVHYQSVALDNGVQQNVIANMTATQSGNGIEYIIDVTVPSAQALVYSFTFQNSQGLQYDTGVVNFPQSSTLGGLISSTSTPTQQPTPTPAAGQSISGYTIPSSISGVDVNAIESEIAQYSGIAQAVLSGANYTISYANNCADAQIITAVGSANINACNLAITQNGNSNTITGTFTATITSVFGPVINGGSLNAGALPSISGLSTPTKVLASSAAKTYAAASLIGAAAVAMIM